VCVVPLVLDVVFCKCVTAVAHAAPASGPRVPGAIPAPSLVYLRVAKLVGAMRMDIAALVRLPSACFLSVPPPQLPLESGHGEHLLSELRLVMEHRPRARQMSGMYYMMYWGRNGAPRATGIAHRGLLDERGSVARGRGPARRGPSAYNGERPRRYRGGGTGPVSPRG
jgi:hypothetical protein